MFTASNRFRSWLTFSRYRRFFRHLWNLSTLTTFRKVATGVLALALVAGVGAGSFAWDLLSNKCGSGIWYRGLAHECIGVTDGSYVFAADLGPVEHAILQENQNTGPGYVTIALLLPMTAPDPLAQAQILHSVQGAYAAQYRANHEANSEVPPIRLALASPGLNSSQWPYVVQQLESMAGKPYNLRAVVGIGVSTATTQAEVQSLTANHIPIVGGSISAADIANTTNGPSRFPGLARVSPTSLEVAKALTHLNGVNPHQTVLVMDTRTDDDYITSLIQAFSTNMSEFPVEPYTFSSPADESLVGGTANEFQEHVVPDLCETNTRWIYFAGRQVQLEAFVNALAQRPCPSRSFTVLTGSAASHLVGDPNLDWPAFSHGITLDFAAIASPAAWNSTHDPVTGGSLADYQAFSTALMKAGTTHAGPIGPTGLADGETIINYDATWTAISGIRLKTDGTQVPPISGVASAWSELNGIDKVDGASGWICLDNAGNPYDKAIPIVKYSTSGQPVFVTLAWPAGSPPPANCQIPPGG